MSLMAKLIIWIMEQDRSSGAKQQMKNLKTEMVSFELKCENNNETNRKHLNQSRTEHLAPTP